MTLVSNCQYEGTFIDNYINYWYYINQQIIVLLCDTEYCYLLSSTLYISSKNRPTPTMQWLLCLALYPGRGAWVQGYIVPKTGLPPTMQWLLCPTHPPGVHMLQYCITSVLWIGDKVILYVRIVFLPLLVLQHSSLLFLGHWHQA